MKVLVLKESSQYNGYGEQVILTPDFKPAEGERYWIPSKEVFSVFKKYVHTGIRDKDNNFFLLSKLRYLTLQNGAYVLCHKLSTKIVTKWLKKEEYIAVSCNKSLLHPKAKLSTGISKKTGKPYYRLETPELVKDDPVLTQFAYEEKYILPEPKLSSYKCIRDRDQMIHAFQYFTDLEKGTFIGLDYETDGIPFDNKYHKLMGVSLATSSGIAAYFDIQWMEEVGNTIEDFKHYYRLFLDKHHENVITYNASFEIRCTYLLLKKIYQFQDASTINKIEDRLMKNYSLKYTSALCLHTRSWDDEFEVMQEKLGEIFLGVWKDKGKKTEKCLVKPRTREDFKESPQWKFLVDRYPDQVDEFLELMSRHWGRFFSCMPYEILGKYCCLDSFHTVLLREYGRQNYSDLCWNTFDANLRMGTYLSLNGVMIDTDELKYQMDRCNKVICLGNLTVSEWILRDKLRSLNEPSLSENEQSLISAGYKYWDGKEMITKMTTKDYETADLPDEVVIAIQSCLVKNKINLAKVNLKSRSRKQFDDFSASLMKTLNLTKPSSSDITWISASNKLKWVSYAQEHADLDSDTISVDCGKTEIPWKKAISKLETICNLNSPDGMTRFIYGTLGDNWDALLTCVRKGKRPKDENGKRWSYLRIIEEGWTYDAKLGTFDHADIRMTTKYPYMIHGRFKFIDNIISGKIPVDDETIVEYAKLVRKYPFLITRFFGELKLLLVRRVKNKKLKKLSEKAIKEYLSKEEEEDLITEDEETHEDDVNKSEVDSEEVKDVSEEVDDPEEIMEEDDTPETEVEFDETEDDTEDEEEELLVPEFDYRMIPKIKTKSIRLDTPLGTLLYMNTHKIDKSIGSKGGGIYTAVNATASAVVGREGLSQWMVDNWKNIDIMNRKVDGYLKLYTSFKMVKRYSKSLQYLEGMLSSTLRYTPEYDENRISVSTLKDSGPMPRVFPKLNVCEKKSKRWSSDFHTIPSESAIKKVVAAPKGDLLTYFDISGAEVRSIVYKSGCKFFLDNYAKGLDPYVETARILKPGNTEEFYWKKRGAYKSIILGRMYGIGMKAMAGPLAITVDEMIEMNAEFSSVIPEIDKFIKSAVKYTEKTSRVHTILGDIKSIASEPHDRWSRLAINLMIQGFSAVALAAGFEKIITESIQKGYPKVRPLNVVHDSCQNYIQSDSIWDISEFYHQWLTEWCHENYGVRYEFKTLIGPNYFDLATLKTTDDPNIVKLSGPALAINGILDSLDVRNVKYECYLGDEKIDRLATDIIDDKLSLMSNKIASFREDMSNYECKLVKL